MPALNDIMEFDHVIRVHEDGTITEPREGIYAPEVTVSTDADGQISDEDEREMTASVEREGWSLLTGFTGQHMYRGPIMHASEFVGGGLETHIRETPGYYVVTAVECLGPEDDSEEEPAGWCVAYRETI